MFWIWIEVYHVQTVVEWNWSVCKYIKLTKLICLEASRSNLHLADFEGWTAVLLQHGVPVNPASICRVVVLAVQTRPAAIVVPPGPQIQRSAVLTGATITAQVVLLIERGELHSDVVCQTVTWIIIYHHVSKSCLCVASSVVTCVCYFFYDDKAMGTHVTLKSAGCSCPRVQFSSGDKPVNQPALSQTLVGHSVIVVRHCTVL